MLKGATYTAGSAAIGRLVTLIAGVVAARALGAAGFGALSLCQSTAAVATAIAGMGLPWVATRTIAANRVSDPTRTYRLWRLLILLCVGGVAVVFIVALSAAGPLTRLIFGDGADPTLFAACIALFVGYTINNFGQAVLMGTEQFAVVARWAIIRALVPAIGLLVGVWAGGPVNAVMGYAFGEYIVLVPLLRRCRLLLRAPGAATGPRATTPPAGVGGAWQLALAAWGSTLLLHPAFWCAQILLIRVSGGYAALGVFALAQRAVQAVVMLPGSISVSSVPILTGCWVSERRDDFARAARTYAAGYLAYVVPVAVIAGVTAPLTLRFFGPEYASAWPVFAVLMIATVPMVLNNLLSTMAMASSRSTLWLLSDLSQAVALVCAATLMIPHLGGVGASLSYLTASVVTCLALVPVTRGLKARP